MKCYLNFIKIFHSPGCLRVILHFFLFQKSFDEWKTYQPTSKDSLLVMKYRKPENISSIIELRYLSWLHFSSKSWHLTKNRNDFQKISYKRISICANCQLQNFLGKRLYVHIRNFISTMFYNFF